MNYNKIKDIANSKNIALKDLAEKVGISETGLHTSIRNETMKIDVLEKIAVELGVDINIFFGGEGKQRNNADWEREKFEMEKKMLEFEQKLLKHREFHFNLLSTFNFGLLKAYRKHNDIADFLKEFQSFLTNEMKNIDIKVYDEFEQFISNNFNRV